MMSCRVTTAGSIRDHSSRMDRYCSHSWKELWSTPVTFIQVVSLCFSLVLCTSLLGTHASTLGPKLAHDITPQPICGWLCLCSISCKVFTPFSRLCFPPQTLFIDLKAKLRGCCCFRLKEEFNARGQEPVRYKMKIQRERGVSTVDIKCNSQLSPANPSVKCISTHSRWLQSCMNVNSL